MNRMNIRGSEYPLKKIFCDDFVFTIPLYQRSYAWTTEEAEDLYQDLIRSVDGFEKKADDLPPYFLGSIVLIKNDEPDSEVVDGQQRLTTLTMLLSAIRSLVDPEYAQGLTSFLCEKGNIVTRTPTRYRLRLRERDAQFFQKYIQEEGGIEALKDVLETQLSDSQRNIRDNTLGFIRELKKLSQDQLSALTEFIVNRCFLIVVAASSPDLDSVYRIFSVLNSRGLDLSYPDILKAEIINTIPVSDRENYASKWEELEASLGKEVFEYLFINLRAIFSKKRQLKGMIEEFHEYVYPRQPQNMSPQDFIDKTLVPYARALDNIIKANFRGTLARQINEMLKWLNYLDRGRWIPPALYFITNTNYNRQPQLILRFLTDLERLVICFTVSKTPPYKRIDRYCEILKAISDNKDLFLPNSPLQLTAAESREFLRRLDSDMYYLGRICRYVLLRLDSISTDGTATYDIEKLSIEHILPRNPANDSNWSKLFPTKDVREKYVNRLGNLVLLSRGKNMDAENYDFEIKKQKYFFSNGLSTPFVTTNELRDYTDWTPGRIEQRQSRLIGKLRDLWRL